VIETDLTTQICTSGSLWKDHPCCAFVLNNSAIMESPEAVEELVQEFFNASILIETRKDDNLIKSAWIFLDQNEQIVRHVHFETNLSFDPLKLSPDIRALEIVQDYMLNTMGVMENNMY
jgi:NitT/TauT family transport system substrate-binding protein